MTRTKAEYQAISAKYTKLAAMCRDLVSSAESALSAQSRNDLPYLAVQEQEVAAALAILDPPAPPQPVDLPPKLTPNERAVVAKAKERAFMERSPGKWKIDGVGAQSLRAVLPILDRYAL